MDILETVHLEIDHVKNRNYFADQQDENSLKKDLKMLKMTLVKNLSNVFLQKEAA